MPFCTLRIPLKALKGTAWQIGLKLEDSFRVFFWQFSAFFILLSAKHNARFLAIFFYKDRQKGRPRLRDHTRANPRNLRSIFLTISESLHNIASLTRGPGATWSCPRPATSRSRCASRPRFPTWNDEGNLHKNPSCLGRRPRTLPSGKTKVIRS